MTVVCFLPFSHPEYKKKYGEEHGSCQAGIAGFFTEVSRGGVVGMGFVSRDISVSNAIFFLSAVI